MQGLGGTDAAPAHWRSKQKLIILELRQGTGVAKHQSSFSARRKVDSYPVCLRHSNKVSSYGNKLALLEWRRQTGYESRRKESMTSK
jgi:hypothetical protein